MSSRASGIEKISYFIFLPLGAYLAFRFFNERFSIFFKVLWLTGLCGFGLLPAYVNRYPIASRFVLWASIFFIFTIFIFVSAAEIFFGD